MIVSTMSNEEVAKGIISDFPIVSRKGLYVIKKLLHDLIKSKKFPFLKIYEYTSPSKNKWLYVIEIKSKKDHFVNCVNYHYTDKGFRAGYCMNDGNGGDKIAFFNGHFFSRYAERKNLSITDPIEKMKVYLLNNHYISFRTETDDDKCKIIGVVNEGMVFGKKISPDIAIFNTFIPVEMLNEEKSAIFKSMQSEFIRPL